MIRIKFRFMPFLTMIFSSLFLSMSNELNVAPANFSNNDDNLFLDDPEVWIKVLDDVAWTEFKPFGYAELEKSFSEENGYAEFRTGIPEMLIAKKRISTKRTFECKLKQLQPETLAILQTAVIETGTGETYVHIGSEAPTQIKLAMILKGKNNAGKDVELRLRKVLPTTETIKVALGSKEFASLDFKGEVVVDDDPLASNFSWRCNGEKSTTATISSADDDITVASATGIVADMLAYGAGIPAGTHVESVAGSVVTLSAAATASGTLVPVKFVSRADMLKSDVAYWIFEA